MTVNREAGGVRQGTGEQLSASLKKVMSYRRKVTEKLAWNRIRHSMPRIHRCRNPAPRARGVRARLCVLGLLRIIP